MTKRIFALAIMVLSAIGASGFGLATAAPPTGSSGPWPGWTVVQTVEMRLQVLGINRERPADIDTTSRDVCTTLRHDGTQEDVLEYVVSRGYAAGFEAGYVAGTMVHVRCVEYADALQTRRR